MKSSFLTIFAQHLRRFVPHSLYNIIAPPYHFLLALIGALIYRFPAKKLFIIGVTGTKGKTTTVELINSILEEAGKNTALAGTLRFKLGAKSSRNLYKMTMPGRFYLQSFLRRALHTGCTHAIIEMTSEGVKQFRHKYLYPNALVITNISPEHIESHGSYEKYLEAKLKIAKSLLLSPKANRVLVVNADDKEKDAFLTHAPEKATTYSLSDALPYELKDTGIEFTWQNTKIMSRLQGKFNLYNILSAITLTSHIGIEKNTIVSAIEKFRGVSGRMEKIVVHKKDGAPFKEFDVVVDYAHTEDSLRKVYETLAPKQLICVLGATGGGRDKWKRPLMGAVAANYCKNIFLTDEDSYDESPFEILNDLKRGVDVQNKKNVKGGKAPASVEVVMNRRNAIEKAIAFALKGDVVIVSGKGTDPFIMGPNGSRVPWDDATVARESLTLQIENSK